MQDEQPFAPQDPTPVAVSAEGLPAAEMAKVVEAAPEENKEPTPEEMQARFAQIREQIWNRQSLPERERLAKKFGIPIEDVRLEGDSVRYALDPKTNQPRIAFMANQLYAMPKGRGRRKARIGAMQGMMRQMATYIFQHLFEDAEAKARHALKEGEEFKGVPQEEVKKLGQLAAREAGRHFRSQAAISARESRRRHRQARRAGFGLIAGNRARSIFCGR